MFDIEKFTDEIMKDHEAILADSKIEPGSDEDVRFIMLALTGEVGEAANIIKKEWRGTTSTKDAHALLKEELADIFIYLLILARLLILDIGEEAEAKIIKVREKFHIGD